MEGSIITFVILFGVGSVFLGIGIYAAKREMPMNFYSGIEVKASEITDVKAYNKENGIMWTLYSFWYYLAAIIGFFNSMVAFILMFSSCTIGLWLLVVHYKRIEKKYRVK